MNGGTLRRMTEWMLLLGALAVISLLVYGVYRLVRDGIADGQRRP